MAYAMNQLLEAMLENGASDLHIRVGRSPSLRVNGELVAVEGPALTAAETEALVLGVVPPARRAALDLLDAIAEDREPETGMYAGSTNVDMIASVFASAVSGRRVELPLESRGNPLA